MAKKKNTMGLHTLEEQSIALRMAISAFEGAMRAIGTGDREGYAHWTGYISAIRDLAESEAAYGLVRDLEGISARLKGMSWRS